MLIIESKKAIFIHAEKCGGSAIEATLDKHLEIYDIRIGGTRFGEAVQGPFRKRFNLHKHSKAREIRRVLTPEKYQDYFVFCFVRHPLSRIISAYRYLRSGSWNSEVALRVQRMKNIKEFIESPDLSWVTPTSAYIYDREGNNLVNFIGRVESMGEDFAYVCGRLGYEKIPMGKSNVTDSLEPPEQLERQVLGDRNCVDIVSRNYSKDFDIFNYEKPIFQ